MTICRIFKDFSTFQKIYFIVITETKFLGKQSLFVLRDVQDPVAKLQVLVHVGYLCSSKG